MRRLSIRKVGPGTFQVGPRRHGPTRTVRAPNKPAALRKAREQLAVAGELTLAGARSFRHYAHVEHGVTVDTRPSHERR